MAVTAKQVYDRALVLMDEVIEDGTIEIDEPTKYETKAIQILNILQMELLPPSQMPIVLTNINQNMSVSDRVAYLVAPYGLAAHLLLADSNETAPFYQDRYEELKRKITTSIQPIEDVNDVLGGML